MLHKQYQIPENHISHIIYKHPELRKASFRQDEDMYLKHEKMVNEIRQQCNIRKSTSVSIEIILAVEFP